MDIVVATIPHSQQRYETVGDWIFFNPTEKLTMLHVNVSDMGNEDSEFLVAIHEIIEAYLCKKVGITTEQVDQWDNEYELAREAGSVDANSEPGDHEGCPYRKQHLIAEDIERILCTMLKLTWEEHEKNVNSVSNS